MTEEIKIFIGSGLIGFIAIFFLLWFGTKKRIRLKKTRLEIEQEIVGNK